MTKRYPRWLGILFLCGVCMNAWGQGGTWRGTVLDSLTGDPLAFVHVWDPGSGRGTSTDIDGVFQLSFSQPTQSVRLSAVGYYLKTAPVPADPSKPWRIYLTPKATSLREVQVFPEENPAHRIIRAAVKRKKANDPQERDAYRYVAYNKVRLLPGADTLGFLQEGEEPDSSTIDYRNHIRDHHLFMAESVSERKYKKPGRVKEVVQANRVSMLQDPSFAILATDLQPFGFYEDWVTLGDKDFLNPLSRGSWNKYFFLLEDTLYEGADSTFVISFRPRTGKNFASLEGVLSISTRGFALVNITAASHQSPLLELIVQQQYRYHDSAGVWFPEQLHYDMNFTETGLRLEGRSYLREIDLNPVLGARDFDAVTLELADDAARQSDSVWTAYRPDTLSRKEQNTYAFNDSLGQSINLDRRMRIVSSFYDGAFPLGPIDLVLNRLFRYNLYEGFRAGIGLSTNDRISKYVRVGGYYGYGFSDQESKYGGHLQFRANNRSDLRLTLAYSYDVESPGTLHYWKDRLDQNTANLRALFTDWMNLQETYAVQLETRAFRYAWLQAYAQDVQTEITNGYTYFDPERSLEPENTYRVTEAGIRVRYAYKEVVVESFDRYLSLGTKAPIVWFNYAQGIEGGTGEWAYQKVNLKLYKRFQARILGKFSLLVDAGYIDSELPAPMLFFANGTYSDDLPVVVDNTFQTMRFFEFMNDRYVQLFYSHTLFRWYTSNEHIRPEFVLTQNAAWGELAQETPGFHQNLRYSDLRHGYYESGLGIHHLYRLNYLDVLYAGFGVGGYYRWGAYQFPEFRDNWALRMTLNIEF